MTKLNLFLHKLVHWEYWPYHCMGERIRVRPPGGHDANFVPAALPADASGRCRRRLVGHDHAALKLERLQKAGVEHVVVTDLHQAQALLGHRELALPPVIRCRRQGRSR